MKIMCYNCIKLRIIFMIKSYVLNKSFIVQQLGDKTIIFDGNDSVLYTLNETATFILHKMKRGLSKEEILKKLLQRYAVTQKKALADLENLFKILQSKNVLLKSSQ